MNEYVLNLQAASLANYSRRTLRKIVTTILTAGGRDSSKGIPPEHYKIILRLQVRALDFFRDNSMNFLRLLLTQLYQNLSILALTPVKLAVKFPEDDGDDMNPVMMTIDIILYTLTVDKYVNTLVIFPQVLDLMRNDFFQCFHVAMLEEVKGTNKKAVHIYEVPLDFEKRG